MGGYNYNTLANMPERYQDGEPTSGGVHGGDHFVEMASAGRYSKRSVRKKAALVVLTLVVGVASTCWIYFSGSSGGPIGWAPSSPKTMRSEDMDILGSSHHHHHDEHHHDEHHPDEHHPDHSNSRASLQAVAGLQLREGYPSPEQQQEYVQALAKIDWSEVEDDIVTLLTSSQDFWPADYGNYGGLFVRLAWHSCGSYRNSDGRGGCDGGAQRFDPERSWADNTNLDKARRLLEPIKLKYGLGLSWGDLFALSGTVAIKAMGGPDPGFCAGRLDVVNNRQTLPLGPSDEQEQFAPCPVNGQCKAPLGTNTLGLIYVNPEGPMGIPDPSGAAETVREVFGRMNWEGRELVALIGGGHTFGKSHGASTAPNGDPPNKCPFASWDGPKLDKAITSGFEGPWTSHPTRWDNHYFQYLRDFDWEPHIGPGGHWQWRAAVTNDTEKPPPRAPSADPDSNEKQDIMMLTTDVSLKVDPEFNVYVNEFAADETAFAEAFGRAWYTLVTRDMGPWARCVGKPPKPYSFQHSLPEPHHKLADMDKVAHDVRKLMKDDEEKVTGKELVRLAYQCAVTFRATDYQGGCNGARIRYPPGRDWPINAGLDEALAALEPIKEKYGAGLSFADLIVLAGTAAAEEIIEADVPKLKFCPGRTDASNGSGWKHLEYGNTDHPKSVVQMIELIHRRGQSIQDFVALTLVKYGSSKGLASMLASDDTAMSDGPNILDAGLRHDPNLRTWAEFYVAGGDDVYGYYFAEAWTRLMNADRFDGPVGNVCG